MSHINALQAEATATADGTSQDEQNVYKQVQNKSKRLQSQSGQS